MTDNHNWLAEYIQTGSDAAFCELVTRYVDLVYSTALRLVGGDAHRAKDVAQIVFANLARVARTLPADVKLGGWLHRDTCFTASTLLRGEQRRQARERQAVEMNALQITSEADYSLVAPVLDEAINELGDEDRTAILLRFFEQYDFRSVGTALGSTEDAARMRVTRALEKLEDYLKRRGITTTATSLSVVLSANAVQAAPVGLALTISTAAVLTGTTLATTTTVTATKAIAMTALQKTIVTATIAVLAGAGIYEARQASHLRGQVQALQQQQAPLAEQIEQLQLERKKATEQLATVREDNERLNRNTSELLKLRGRVNGLEKELAIATKMETQAAGKPAVSSPHSAWKLREPRKLGEFQNVGTDTAEATAETVLWAAQNNSTNLVDMIHLPAELLTKAKTEGSIDVLARQLAAQLVGQVSVVAKDEEKQVWIDDGNKTKYAQITPDGTNSYDGVIDFKLSGRSNMQDSDTERHTDLLFANIDGVWKVVIPGLSPEIREK